LGKPFKLNSKNMETNMSSPSFEGQVSSIPPATGSSTLNVGQAERIISVIGGTTMAVLAIRNWNKVYGKAFGVLGAILLKRGVTGFCEVNHFMGRNTAHKKAAAMEVKATFTINKPREEVYSFWRNLENLPSFMKHLDEVEVLDEKRSSWTAKLPGGVGKVSWEAVIQEEEPNALLSWSSLPGSKIDNAGELRFAEAPRNEGTEVHARISYRLPAGDVGSLAGKLFNPLVEGMIREDLRRFKSLLETGEIPSSKHTRRGHGIVSKTTGNPEGY
jgi:uncharacterized membrane protein